MNSVMFLHHLFFHKSALRIFILPIPPFFALIIREKHPNIVKQADHSFFSFLSLISRSFFYLNTIFRVEPVLEDGQGLYGARVGRRGVGGGEGGRVKS